MGTATAPVAPAIETGEFTPVLLLNIRYPEERVAFTLERPNPNYPTDPKRRIKIISGESAQFQNTQYLATTKEAYDAVLAACPYVFIEPTEGPPFKDEKYHFSTRNIDAFNAWMNCEWRNAKEEAVG